MENETVKTVSMIIDKLMCTISKIGNILAAGIAVEVFLGGGLAIGTCVVLAVPNIIALIRD